VYVCHVFVLGHAQVHVQIFDAYINPVVSWLHVYVYAWVPGMFVSECVCVLVCVCVRVCACVCAYVFVYACACRYWFTQNVARLSLPAIPYRTLTTLRGTSVTG